MVTELKAWFFLIISLLLLLMICSRPGAVHATDALERTTQLSHRIGVRPSVYEVYHLCLRSPLTDGESAWGGLKVIEPTWNAETVNS